jgi:hypothetical protein
MEELLSSSLVLPPGLLNFFNLQPPTSSLQPSTFNPQPSTLNPQPSTLNPQPSTLNPQPSTLNPQPSTLNPQPSTFNLQPSTFNVDNCVLLQKCLYNHSRCSQEARYLTQRLTLVQVLISSSISASLVLRQV